MLLQFQNVTLCDLHRGRIREAIQGTQLEVNGGKTVEERPPLGRKDSHTDRRTTRTHSAFGPVCWM